MVCLRNYFFYFFTFENAKNLGRSDDAKRRTKRNGLMVVASSICQCLFLKQINTLSKCNSPIQLMPWLPLRSNFETTLTRFIIISNCALKLLRNATCKLATLSLRKSFPLVPYLSDQDEISWCLLIT